MNIRKYRQSDFEDFKNICIETADGALKSDEKKRKLLTLTYCEYYVEREGDSCFALTDDNDRAVGYILCAKNALVYKRLFKDYIKRIAKISPVSAASAYWGARIYLPYYKKYPAHLHIDILPEYQGSGNGTRLMQQLKKELISRRIKGVMLCVGANNKGAIEFYRKNGFKTLREIPGALLFMGCEL